MHKAECEIKIRQLVHMWLEEQNISRSEISESSFALFKDWLQQSHYSHYLDFRSHMGAVEDAEFWFVSETGQTWRRCKLASAPCCFINYP